MPAFSGIRAMATNCTMLVKLAFTTSTHPRRPQRPL
jgi:hypothetical protein